MLGNRLAGQITRTNCDVGAVQSADNRGCECSVVLPIGIDCKYGCCAFLQRCVEAGAKCGSLAAVLVEFDRFIRDCAEQLPGSVRRAVVDSDYPCAWQVATNVLDYFGKCRLGVVCRHDDDERLDQVSILLPFSSICPSRIANMERRSVS